MLVIGNFHGEVDGQELYHGVNLTIPAGEVHALLGNERRFSRYVAKRDWR